MVLAISVVLTAWTALILVLTTHGTRSAAMWACGIAIPCQGLWVVFDVLTGAYGLLPLALVYVPLNVRGWYRWRAA